MGFKLEQEDQGAAPKIQVESDNKLRTVGGRVRTKWRPVFSLGLDRRQTTS